MEKITSLRLYPYTQNYTLTTQPQNSKLSNPNPYYNFRLSLHINTDEPIFSLLHHSIHPAILSSVWLFSPSSLREVSEFYICNGEEAFFNLLHCLNFVVLSPLII